MNPPISIEKKKASLTQYMLQEGYLYQFLPNQTRLKMYAITDQSKNDKDYT